MESKAFDHYHRKEFAEAKQIFESLSKNTTDNETKERYLFNAASCTASSGDIESAHESFASFKFVGNDLLYNKALCAYKLCNYSDALEIVNQLLNNCEASYPELFIKQEDQSYDDEELRVLLQESCIIEAFNLKAAVTYQQARDLEKANECLAELPVDREEQWDCITLHNKAIYGHQDNLESTIGKLVHLSEFWLNSENRPELTTHLPTETFKNLLILYTLRKDPNASEALEFMRKNKTLIEQNMDKESVQFLDIYFNCSCSSASDELVYRKLDRLATQFLDKYISLEIQSDKTESRLNAMNKLCELILVVVLHEGTILWNNDQYSLLEKLLTRVSDKIKNVDANQMVETNLAHTLFMTDTRFDECAQLYEDLINQSSSKFKLNPQVLSSLCVAYVLTGRNNDAEALIKDIEYNERTNNSVPHFALAAGSKTSVDSSVEVSALCCINLVIGTLYCVKYNYEFGLARMFKSLVPLEHKLNYKTWFYTKRCILSLLDRHCKQMICVRDDLLDQVIIFLIQCERVGVLIDTSDPQKSRQNPSGAQVDDSYHSPNTVANEARYLRSILLTVIHE